MGDGLTRDLSDPRLGTLFDDRYRIERVLGEGAHGVVYLAVQVSLRRQVALKVLRSRRLSDPTHVRRFRREAMATGGLRSPNTIQLYDFGVTDSGDVYLVSEYLRGETLQDRLRRAGALAPAQAVAITRGVLCSLIEAHHIGLVHRDLKPANIFLVRVGTSDRVKVLDFGLVKLLADTDELGRLTRTGVVQGTPRYIAPEAALARKIDARTDLYSAGVVLYEMLAGQPPFNTGSVIETMLQHIHQPVPPLVAPGVPAALQAVVYRCLEKDPDHRFESACVMRDALDAAEGGGEADDTSWEEADTVEVAPDATLQTQVAPTQILVAANDDIDLPAPREPTREPVSRAVTLLLGLALGAAAGVAAVLIALAV